ncbi:MAG: hypothetical protein ACRDZQ_08835 [Acidimicrobiales bacterium]
MTRTELVGALLAAQPEAGDIVYVERRGERYAWRLLAPAEPFDPSNGPGSSPDVWIYSAAGWPASNHQELGAFIEDLLAEMESMQGGADRCRWPLDDPWPHRH